MKKKYTSFDEMSHDLRLLKLKRKIAIEELKYSKQELHDIFTPNQWVSTTLGFVKKYGILYIIKKIFR